MSQPVKLNSQWVRWRAAAYLGGKGLSWGCGNDPIVPQQAIDGGKYSLNIDVAKAAGTDICDTDISILTKDSMDHVFVGPREGAPVKDLISKLKIGGHLVYYGVDLDPEILRKSLAELGYWQEKDTYIRENQFLGIWKLLGRAKREILSPKPKPTKRACIARYGAIGDMVMITPLIRQLAEDGYHVTMNITPYCAEVIKCNPYVGNVVLQERDMIPNQDLGQYWNEWMGDYDKYINLSESIEGKLLKVEGRRDFYTTKDWRDATCSANYYDHTLALGGYPEVTGKRGELYFSNAEEKECRFLREKFKDRFMIMWSLKGSSHHKIYPMLAPVLSQWLDKHKDAIAILVGAAADSVLAFEHPQVVSLAGKNTIRHTFCLAKYCDLVAGPESSVINAAACYDVPKMAFLTHSHHDNLCKYWTNDYCLQADIACSPCHQLHYTLESCPLVSISEDNNPQPAWSGPVCAAAGFPPSRVMARLDEIYNHWANAK